MSVVVLTIAELTVLATMLGALLRRRAHPRAIAVRHTRPAQHPS